MRVEPRKNDPELETILQYLDFQRETVLLKAEGLTKAQMAQRLPPSTLSLAGMLYHLAIAEEDWMEVRFAGMAEREDWAVNKWDTDRDWEFHVAQQMEPDEVKGRYRLAAARTTAIVRAASGLSQQSVAEHDGEHFSLRWVLLHLIEETARHAGHADFIRESIDGAVGE